MIYFIYGEDSYRSKKKLEEIVLSYKEKHKSGLNLIYVDTLTNSFGDFYNSLKINSMFAEKKLIVLRNLFLTKSESVSGWQEDFLENIKKIEELKDIVVVYESSLPDKRTKLFKALQKNTKCQEFNLLTDVNLKKWIASEFLLQKVKINNDAVDLLASYIGSDLWRMANEINKLSNYKKGTIVLKENVELLVKPNIDNDIFKTIDALASKNKKLALSLLHKHMDGGDFPLYLLSMIAYQFRNLLIIKDLSAQGGPASGWQKKSGLHPFVIQKSSYLCSQFSMVELKKIYQKIFQIDLNIKTGKIEAETAIDLLISEI
ncbi:MAG: DNA polymerase III subunit delta [Candidatus Staskawiczbacteria bacterium]